MKRATEAIVVAVVAAVVMVAMATLLVMAVNKVLKLDDASGVSSGDATIASKESSAWFDGDKMLSTWRDWVDGLKGQVNKDQDQNTKQKKSEASRETSRRPDANQVQNREHKIYKVGNRVADLPLIMAGGNVPSTRVVMSEDPTHKLQDLLIQFVGEKDASAREALLNPIIFAWTGADKYAKDSRGAYIDGRMVYALEAYFADEFIQNGGLRNPSSNAAIHVTESYQIVRNYVNATMLMQSHLQPYMTLINNDMKAYQLRKDRSKAPEFKDLIDELKRSYAKDKNQAIQLAKDIRYVLEYGSTNKEKGESALKALLNAVSLISDKDLIEFRADIYVALYEGTA